MDLKTLINKISKLIGKYVRNVSDIIGLSSDKADNKTDCRNENADNAEPVDTAFQKSDEKENVNYLIECEAETDFCIYKDFIIPKNKALLKISDSESMNVFFMKIKNTSAMKSALNYHKMQLNDLFYEQLKNYEYQLNNLIEEYEMTEEYDENKSSWFVKNVFMLADKNIIKGIISDFYVYAENVGKGRASTADYISFILALNDYLRSIGISTIQAVRLGEIVSSDIYSYYKVNYEYTDLTELHGRIKAIQGLAYEMNYIDDEGKKRRLVIPGLLRVYNCN